MSNSTVQEGSGIVIISIADILAFIIRRWKTLICLLLAGAVVIGGGLSWNEYKSIGNRYSDSSLQSLKAALSGNQVTNVEQLYQRYLNYREQINLNEAYMRHSFLMKADPNEISNYRKEYIVQSDQADIVESFAGSALGQEDYRRIADIIGNDVDERYVYEIVSIKGSNATEMQSLDIDGTNDVFQGNILKGYNGLMIVSITASDKMQCEKIASIVDEAILKHFQKLTAAGINMKLIEAGASYTESLPEELLEKRKNRIADNSKTLSEFNSFYTNNIDKLSSEEKALFNYFTELDDTINEHVHWKKYVVLGAAAGLFIGILLCVLKYLLSDTIHIVEEMEKQFGMLCLGTIYPDGKRHGLNRIALFFADQIAYNRKMNEPNNKLEVILLRLEKLCRNNHVDRVYVVTNDHDEAAENATAKITGYLSGKGIAAASGHPRHSVEELEEFCNATMAVYVGTLNRINRGNLKSITTIGEENSTPVQAFLAVADS